MDSTTKLLFGRLPREVACPQRWVVDSWRDFSNFVENNNGLYDCYTSVYPTNYLIDKIFFDCDYGGVLEDTKLIYKWAMKNEYDAIPIVSGKKGYHIYIITKPKIYGKDAKLLLTKATYSIIKSIFGSFKQELFITPYGKEVQVFRNMDRIITVDPAPCGDIRRISRIPQTLRPPENLNYCTYLPPDDFLDMTEEDIITHMKQPHTYNYKVNFNKAPLLTDFEYEFDDECYTDWTPMATGKIVKTENPNLFLKGILRPCLYRHLTSIHPSHPVRVASTIDLLNAGFSPTEILSLYEKLGWEDFTPDYCLSQIESCMRFKKPYSCSKLRNMGIPRTCCVEAFYLLTLIVPFLLFLVR